MNSVVCPAQAGGVAAGTASLVSPGAIGVSAPPPWYGTSQACPRVLGREAPAVDLERDGFPSRLTLGIRAKPKFRSARALPHRGPLESGLLIDSVVLQAALVFGRTVASEPERGAYGGVSVLDDVVHRRAA